MNTELDTLIDDLSPAIRPADDGKNALRVELLTLALHCAREILWCIKKKDNFESWKLGGRNMALMEIAAILEGVVLDPRNIPPFKPDLRPGRLHATRRRIAELKEELGLPST